MKRNILSGESAKAFKDKLDNPSEESFDKLNEYLQSIEDTLTVEQIDKVTKLIFKSK